MIKRFSKLFLALSLVVSVVSSVLTPTVTYAASSNIIDQSSTSSGNLTSVAFGNGVFVAVGMGNVSTSTNGVDWSIETVSPKLNSVIFAKNSFRALANGEKAIYISADGKNWTKQALSITPERIKEINNELFIWQSEYRQGTNPPAYNVTLLHSSDGNTWTDTNIKSTDSTFGMQSITDIAFGQGKYVVSGLNTVYYTSTDLSSWTTNTLTNLVITYYGSQWPYINNVIFMNGRFFSYLATNSNNKVLTSTDGSSWTVSSSWDNKSFNGGAFINNNYVLLGRGEVYKSSTAPIDSNQWGTSNTNTTMMVNSIAFGNGKYVAAGGGSLLVSEDLNSWTNQSGNLKSIASDGNGNYIAVTSGDYGSIYKSNGSGVWADVTPSKLPGLNDVTYGAGQFLAVTSNGKIVTSSDGVAWKVGDSGFQSNLVSVAFGGNQYVAVSDYGGIYSSVDGNTWINNYENLDLAFNTVVYLNNEFIALGAKYDSQGFDQESVVVARSSNGTQWSVTTDVGFPNTTLSGIAYNGNNYVLVGGGSYTPEAVILTTKDFVSFTKVPTTASMLNSISYGNGSFLATGNNGGLYSSVDGASWNLIASEISSSLNDSIFDGTNFKVVGSYFARMTLSLGPVLAHTMTATAVSLTPAVGVDNAITLTVKNSLGDTDTAFDGTKEVTVSGYVAAPDGTYGSLNGTALAVVSTKANVEFVAGVATVSLKLNKAGTQSIVFSQAGVSTPAATALNMIPVAGITAALKLTNSLIAPVVNGGSFAQQPVITLVDAFGNVNVADNSTIVSASKKDAGSWTLTGNVTEAAVAGVVTFTSLGAKNAAGVTGAQLAFDATGLTQLTSGVVNLPKPAGAQSITALPVSLTPVVGADNVITLTVKNSLGDTDTAFDGTKEVTVSGYVAAPDGTYGSLNGTALAAASTKANVEFVAGVATVSLKLNKAGAQSIVFSQAGVATPAATALNMIPVAGITAALKLTNSLIAPAVNGGSFAQQPVITLVDAFGNVNVADNSTIVSASKKDAGSWTLTGNVTEAAVAGVVTFTSLGAKNAAGVTGAQLAFDATGLTQLTSGVVNLPQPAGAQSITALPVSLTPVVGADNVITLTVKNSLGDTDTAFDGTKEVTVSGYVAAPDGTYGSLNGTALAATSSKANVEFAAGVATVSLKLNKAGAQSIVFSQVGVATPAATALNMIPVAGITAALKLTNSLIAPVVNGGSFAQQPVITLVDAFGNVNVADNSTIVSASKKDAGSWTLTGNVTEAAVAGVVTFTSLGAKNAAGVTGAQLAFDATGLTQLTSGVVNLPQPAGAQSITALPVSLTPVVGADNVITLIVKNSLGDTDTAFDGTKEVTISGYVAAPDGTYGSLNGTALAATSSKANVEFAAGVATVSLKLNKAGAQSIVFSQAGVVTPATAALNMIPVAGSTKTMKLTTGISAPQTNGGSFAQQPVITLVDAFGNVNVADNSTIISATKKDTGSWTLTGNVTETAVAGVVTFTSLGAKNAAGVTGAQVEFAATDLTPITSAVIDLNWPELAAPSIETVTPGNGHVYFTWSPVYGADRYAIYQSTASGAYGAELTTVSGSENSYDAVDLINGTPYYFVVKAINPSSTSVASNEVTRTPQVPAPGAPILHAPVAANGLIGLSWDPVNGAVGYTIYQGINSGVYETKVATVSESVYNYDVTGLTNGEAYYFVVKASNPGGESEASNEVSTKPRTTPAAPTDVIAVAGDGEATVTFTAPASNGGTPITNYEITASPGNIVTVGAASPIKVTGLLNGTSYSFTVKAINSVGSSVASDVSNSVVPKIIETTPTTPEPTVTSSPTATPSPTSVPTVAPTSATSTSSPTGNVVDVLVDGKAEQAGTAILSERNGQSVTTIVVDPAKLEQRIANGAQNVVITIPVTATSDVIVGELNGQMIKSMEQKQALIVLQTPKGNYDLPAAQIDINTILAQLGANSSLQDLKVQITISAPASDIVKSIEALVAKQQLTLVAQPLTFTVAVSSADKAIELPKFKNYVERLIPLMDGIDPNKVTTGLVLEKDGSIRHLPTQLVVIDGKSYAKVHSLTNDTVFVVQNSKNFRDVMGHWAQDIVNEMGARSIINGFGDNVFKPNQAVTRAEFAAIIVRGLGLSQEGGTSAAFGDVEASAWYSNAIQVAYANHLINGFGDGNFRPSDQITREQAMNIISKAMSITDLSVQISSEARNELLNAYADAKKASEWAKNSIAVSVKAGIISGRSKEELAPKALITRAEIAAILQRLLQKSDLI